MSVTNASIIRGSSKRSLFFPKGRQVDPLALDEVRDLLADLPRRRDLLIEHLHLIQDRYGHLSARHLAALAEEMKLAMTEVYEVATFYTMYNLKPVGKHHVQVCTNLPCWLQGSDAVTGACRKFLGIDFGMTTEDGMFTLSEVECLGACVNAPMMQIGDDYYEDLDSGSTEEILEALKALVLRPRQHAGPARSSPLRQPCASISTRSSRACAW